MSLRECPSSPNCVCSLETKESHAIDPFVYTVSSERVLDVLKETLGALSRSKLVKEATDFLHYEVKTKLFRFTDDVEIWHDRANKTIHFRSASRVGYSDLGTNRRRIESLKHLLQEKLT